MYAVHRMLCVRYVNLNPAQNTEIMSSWRKPNPVKYPVIYFYPNILMQKNPASVAILFVVYFWGSHPFFFLFLFKKKF